MSIRFGIGVGGDVTPADLPGLVDRLETDGVDSLWFSELIYSPAVDPFVGMAFAASRTTTLKVGTSVAILPGRQPTLVVAKQLISLSALAPRRVLPVFGLQTASPRERDLFPVVGRRGDVFDDALRGCAQRSTARTSGRAPRDGSTSGSAARHPPPSVGSGLSATGGWGASSRPQRPSPASPPSATLRRRRGGPSTTTTSG